MCGVLVCVRYFNDQSKLTVGIHRVPFLHNNTNAWLF